MKKRQLGKQGPMVSALGLGCMAMSEFYGSSDDAVSRTVILSALKQGLTMLDTADTYGAGHNEELIGKVLKDWTGEVFLATKFGIVRRPGEYARTICGRPEYVKQACDASLRRLGRETIDLYYAHRIDDTVPIEDTVGAMAELVHTGKVRYIGLSEPAAATLRRAHAVYPITAVQSEYSLWTRDIESQVIPAMRELGVALVPYSPLGRGALTGKLDRQQISQSGDLRPLLPRFSEKNLPANLVRTGVLFDMAAAKGVSPAQLALAWILARGDDIVPIPGTRRLDYLNENLGAVDIILSTEETHILDQAFAPGTIAGERYTPEGMAGLNK
ncbi:oxidoreductase [Desulfosarcina ovata subsp. sediminis]|uniref:Oxidoreductase n=1 Tax=Desulfosarcina ovata subsp. sediminis TaxID=885957 RepID=A0A5K7ZXW5_9BACT|nr:aldo/keto reductase [Desulfosarcina ovata]BBO85113.1 oxidoreductase [Desulfosarcina ovata subsp. sediminis]